MQIGDRSLLHKRNRDLSPICILQQVDDLFDQQAAGHNDEEQADKPAALQDGHPYPDMCSCHIEKAYGWSWR